MGLRPVHKLQALPCQWLLTGPCPCPPPPARFNEEVALQGRMQGLGQVIQQCGYPDLICLQVGASRHVVGASRHVVGASRHVVGASRHVVGGSRHVVQI